MSDPTAEEVLADVLERDVLEKFAPGEAHKVAAYQLQALGSAGFTVARLEYMGTFSGPKKNRDIESVDLETYKHWRIVESK